MKMEFNPIDAIIPAGHSIKVELTETGEDYLSSACAPVGMLVNLDASSTISLPLLERDADAPEWFKVPQWWEE
jgi:hypothetical protein